MFVSVIICTYRRATDLERLLQCLIVQTYREFELLIIDGSDGDSAVRCTVDAFANRIDDQIRIRCISSSKGLTRQRNIGLREAQGEIVCFLDDDVTMGESFLAQVVALFQRVDMQNVGGITGYDVLHYLQPITLQWRLRWWLRVIPSLKPGDADHLGRNSPLIFAASSSECIDIKWLPGFCMIYRRTAISDLWFDESLPTYGGEDKDFSMEVGQCWRLCLCCDLLLEHHSSTYARDHNVLREYQWGFGMGRICAKRAKLLSDYIAISHFFLAEFIVNILAVVSKPSRERLERAFARPYGMILGVMSINKDSRIHGRNLL
jgi:GT2 family glycosyltransferase